MIDATQIDRNPDKTPAAVGERSAKQKNSGSEPWHDPPPPPVMVRLHNPQTGVQILVSETKAIRLIAEGNYREGPIPA